MTIASTSHHRKGAGALLLAVATSLLLAACGGDESETASAAGGGSGAKSENVTLRVGYIGTAGKFAGVEGFAHSKGKLQEWLKPAGVSEIKPVEFANGPLLTQALVGKSLDVSISGDTPQLIAEGQGVPAQAIFQGRVGIPAWIVAKKGGPKSVKELAGKKVARQQASFQDRYLQGRLAEEGLAGKVELAAMLNPQAASALQNGSLDAAAIAVVQAKKLADDGFPVIDKSEDRPELQGTTIATARDAFAEQHPEVVKAFTDAHFKAIEFAKEHPDEYYAYSAEAYGIDAETAELWENLDTYPEEKWSATGVRQLQGTLDFLIEQKLAKPFALADFGVEGV